MSSNRISRRRLLGYSGGVAAADLVMLDVAMELYDGADAQRGFANTADAFNKDIEPPTLVFEGK